MNTRNAHNGRRRGNARRNSVLRHGGGGAIAPVGLGIKHPHLNLSLSEGEGLNSAEAISSTQSENMATASPSERGGRGNAVAKHPLSDGYTNARLAHCEDSVKGRFDVIAPFLKGMSGIARGTEFADKAREMSAQWLDYKLPDHLLDGAWVSGADMKSLYAHCVFSALKSSAAQFVDDMNKQLETVQDTKNFFLDCGFHAVDISPCADGRLKGLSRYILRLPMSSFTRRKAYAGALFDVETDVHHWEETELRRFREGVPTTVDAGTRYLKVAVYHTSSSSPFQEGCAAHGSSEAQAKEAALERLCQFREAIENSFCCGASTDLLLIGVDTDTDAIRVHVPDSNGDLSVHRMIDNAELYNATAHLSADEARLAVYEAIRTASATEGWGQGRGEPHDGMRRLIANLLINNLSQIEYVADLYNGCYPDIGHAERYISVGDGFEEVQMRNVAYYAHLHTLEEGVADMDVGIKIFKGLNAKHGLPIPVAVHFRYDAKVPGSRERIIAKARRVRDAIKARYTELDRDGFLFCHLSVQDKPFGSPIETVEDGL